MRKTVFKSLLIVGALTLAAVFTIGASAASSSGSYTNGVEKKSDVRQATQEMLNVNRVASGTVGYPAASGKWFGLAPVASDTVNTFTRYGGYSNAFPAGGYTTSVDIYLDTNAQIRTSFDWTSAINDQAGNHRRDFIFNVAGAAD